MPPHEIVARDETDASTHDGAFAPPKRGEGCGYTIINTLHRGGMGEILLAKREGPEGFERKVVLKGLRSQDLGDTLAYDLFMREARLMAALDHPNIVRVFDLALIEGWPFLVMEYLCGRNFHQIIQRSVASGQDMPFAIALHVVAQALRGLHYAHTLRDASGHPRCIVHRDVTPGNILVSFFGEVKLTDFGIAKSVNAPKCTAPRSIRGKARYVAPEQVYGEAASVKSDIYSAGVVLAEAIMGGALWDRATIPETLLAIVSEERSRTIGRIFEGREAPNDLVEALKTALALAPERRFDSALEFAELLEAISARSHGRGSHAEMTRFLRTLYRSAPDLPPEQQRERPAALSLRAIPESPYDDTDPTLIEIEIELLSSAHAGPARDSTEPAGGAVVMIDAPMTDPNRSALANARPDAASVTRSLRAVPALTPSIATRSNSGSDPSALPRAPSTRWDEAPSAVPVRVPDNVRGHPSQDRARRWSISYPAASTLWGLLFGVLIGAALATGACLWALTLS
ncbi:MAG: serine/threonine protein kinase [Deltaproteobacteria bacterium]|nr:serine/threonine protein kinase [Deltaproteobacteria bacterium]